MFQLGTSATNQNILLRFMVKIYALPKTRPSADFLIKIIRKTKFFTKIFSIIIYRERDNQVGLNQILILFKSIARSLN